ncbi:hypothetical protein C0Q70_18448 [Pomacea canaliculata]|uniref:Uncharacterized protein n=1 Tax=Pomacea canaliculata TaxID=400727 RepID=A0A2T7NN73_POMCA|nr:hypothetical protein C0Q70_18448 [Pomacea canaliculata]
MHDPSEPERCRHQSKEPKPQSRTVKFQDMSEPDHTKRRYKRLAGINTVVIHVDQFYKQRSNVFCRHFEDVQGCKHLPPRITATQFKKARCQCVSSTWQSLCEDVLAALTTIPDLTAARLAIGCADLTDFSIYFFQEKENKSNWMALGHPRKSQETIIRRGVRLSSWDLREEKFREIIRAGARKEIKKQHGQSVLDFRTYGKPVYATKERRGWFRFLALSTRRAADFCTFWSTENNVGESMNKREGSEETSAIYRLKEFRQRECSDLLVSPPDNVDELVALYNSTLTALLDKFAPEKKRSLLSVLIPRGLLQRYAKPRRSGVRRSANGPRVDWRWIVRFIAIQGASVQPSLSKLGRVVNGLLGKDAMAPVLPEMDDQTAASTLSAYFEDKIKTIMDSFSDSHLSLFVPPDDVIEAFQQLMDSLDADTDETLSDFLAYFESTCTWLGIVQRGRRRRPKFDVAMSLQSCGRQPAHN